MYNILIVDDNQLIREGLYEILSENPNYNVRPIETPFEAIDIVQRENINLIISDLKMPRMSGIDLLKKTKEISKNSDFILMTAYASVDTAVDAMKLGAYDYITKPFNDDEISIIVEKALEKQNLIRENIELKKKLETKYKFGNIIGKNHKMQEIYTLIEKISPTDSTILILGESGTGKELIANAIHYNSVRKNKPFIKVNCASLSENLLESELFGHIKGAFTGAISDKQGRFEAANRGSIFLDEIGEISLNIQVKLLRVLQEKQFEKVGSSQTISSDVRIIAATNKDLLKLVKEGKFREDLYYRLNVIPLKLFPLREKKDDIPILAEHFLNKLNEKYKFDITLSKEALNILMKYNYPGNIRELEHIIERAVMLTNNRALKKSDFSFLDIEDYEKRTIYSTSKSLSEVEKLHIISVLKDNKWNISKSSKILGVDRKTLYNKLEKYKIKK